MASKDWNRKRTLEEYRAEAARVTPDPRALAAAAGAWLRALSPGKRRAALEEVKRTLLAWVAHYDPKAYPEVKAAAEAQMADRPIPRVRP